MLARSGAAVASTLRPSMVNWPPTPRHHPSFAPMEPSGLISAQLEPSGRGPASSLPLGQTATQRNPFPWLKPAASPALPGVLPFGRVTGHDRLACCARVGLDCADDAGEEDWVACPEHPSNAAVSATVVARVRDAAKVHLRRSEQHRYYTQSAGVVPLAAGASAVLPRATSTRASRSRWKSSAGRP
jgi:hypothetical protein